jgi:hypothetical protein
MSFGIITNDWCTGKYLERCDPGIIKAPSSYFPGGTEENHEYSQNSKCPDRDSKQAPPEYKSKYLPLRQPILVINCQS